MTGSADNAQERVTHRSVPAEFWETLPTSDVYCLLKTRAPQNMLMSTATSDGWLRLVSDRIKGSRHANKHTQPFSTVSSWGQSGPSCREIECLRTLYYNRLPLMQCSFTESQVCLFSTIHPSRFLFTYKPKRDNLRILGLESLDWRVDQEHSVRGRFSGLMGQVVALHLAMKHQRIHWGRRVDYVRVEAQLLTELTV